MREEFQLVVHWSLDSTDKHDIYRMLTDRHCSAVLLWWDRSSVRLLEQLLTSRRCSVVLLVVNNCSNWDTTIISQVFGRSNLTAGNDDSSLNLSWSSFSIANRTDILAIVDDNNRRIILFNRSNFSSIRFVSLGNRAASNDSPSLISFDSTDNIYLLDGLTTSLFKVENVSTRFKNSSSHSNVHSSKIVRFQNNSLMLGMCINPMNQFLLVADYNNDQIIQIDPLFLNRSIYIGTGQVGSQTSFVIRPKTISMDHRQTL